MAAFPILIGIVNITEDSFSDGGLYLDSNKAIDQALHLVKGGATVIELGAASSNPDAKAVSAASPMTSMMCVKSRSAVTPRLWASRSRREAPSLVGWAMTWRQPM
jgi:hypothetical protein